MESYLHCAGSCAIRPRAWVTRSRSRTVAQIVSSHRRVRKPILALGISAHGILYSLLLNASLVRGRSSIVLSSLEKKLDRLFSLSRVCLLSSKPDSLPRMCPIHNTGRAISYPEVNKDWQAGET